MLKLNDKKTEAVLCGSKTQQSKVSVNSIYVEESEMSVCNSVRDPSLLPDSNITLHHQVSALVRTRYFHLGTLWKLQPFLTKKAAISVAVALVLSGLGYCVSCLWGLPGRELHCLQLVLNTAARIVTLTKKREHIRPVLKDLHWLPVKDRTDHKILSLAYNCSSGTAP